MFDEKVLSKEDINLLICPVCRSSLEIKNNNLICSDHECNSIFPFVKGIPILINENNSIFRIDDFINDKSTTFQPIPSWKEKVASVLPETSANLKSKINFRKLKKILYEKNKNSRILVVGGSQLGLGMEILTDDPSISLVETDVSFGPRTKIIVDAHDLPFKDKIFDAVIVQAVLEHVMDPYRCVNEIHRVLKDDGLVYAETPFMQQVHMGCYDFQRFTYLGHRRVFRDFMEISSGAVGGPGMALAWSYKYFLQSFAESDSMKDVINGFTRITGFWLKYFDYYLIKKSGTLDAAFGYYFMGKKTYKRLSDRELIKLYPGNCNINHSLSEEVNER